MASHGRGSGAYHHAFIPVFSTFTHSAPLDLLSHTVPVCWVGASVPYSSAQIQAISFWRPVYTDTSGASLTRTATYQPELPTLQANSKNLTDHGFSLDLASNVANFEVGDVNHPYANDLRRMLQDGTLKGRNYVVNYNSQVLTKYMLLDHLASSLGCHQGDSLVKSR
ncbi:hypothetical protein FIBSPDRAFT_906328, partial [Athelia psychrophila]